MAPVGSALSEWSIPKKLLFCFFFIFFIGYIFLNPNDVVPFSYYLHQLYIRPCNRLIEWLAKDVFHFVSPSIKFYNGTIDTVFGYLTVLFIFFAAIFGSLIWVTVDRGARNYDQLYKALIIILRYYLAISWIAYGSTKIIRLQFPSFSPVMLLQTYGNSTPKDLAWAFMGYSTTYNYLIGFAEYAVGILLFFRRTSTLGNMIGLGIIANVVAFNYSYDVNVKLLTTILLLMTLFLLSKDITRLISFFFFDKIVNPGDDPSFNFEKKWKNKAFQIAKYSFIVFIVFFHLRGDAKRARQLGISSIKPPLYGIYNVTSFIRNKDTLKPLTTDTARWNKLIISSPAGNASIMLMDNSLKNFVFNLDTVKKQMEMHAKSDATNKYTFSYKLEHSVMILGGKWHNDSLEIKLREYDMNKFPIMNSGFRWIIDRNFNKKK